jgi:hypothetical protein
VVLFLNTLCQRVRETQDRPLSCLFTRYSLCLVCPWDTAGSLASPILISCIFSTFSNILHNGWSRETLCHTGPTKGKSPAGGSWTRRKGKFDRLSVVIDWAPKFNYEYRSEVGRPSSSSTTSNGNNNVIVKFTMTCGYYAHKQNCWKDHRVTSQRVVFLCCVWEKMQDLYPPRGCIGQPLICSAVVNRNLFFLESGPLARG